LSVGDAGCASGAYAGAIALTLLAAAAWTTSYSRNRAYTEEVDQALVEIDAQIDALNPSERDPVSLLPLLNAARQISWRLR
jgi:type VI secretion system protein ImpL